MHVAVFLSGVADPKWPLPAAPSLQSLQSHAAQYATLSPFDEAALELALKLRDADPAVRVTALVAAGERLARRVAEWRPDAVHRIELAGAAPWDAAAVAQGLGAAATQLAGDAALVIAGREFGDFDDGSIPVGVSHALGMTHISLALGLQARGDAIWALRQGNGGLERVRLPARALVSVTNDSGNRLRHPLMKNVMAAKKAVIPSCSVGTSAVRADLQCLSVEPVVAAPRSRKCEWIRGAPAQQAEALARLLVPSLEP